MERLLNQFKNGFRLKNALSNLYLYLEEIKSSEAQNVYRIGSIPDSKKATWKLKQGENGYLYISSTTIQGEDLFLTVTEYNNIEPKKFTGENNQKLYIQYKEKGIYLIKSRISKNKFGLELENNKIGINNKLKQGPINGSPEQNWIFEAIEDNKDKTTKLKAANVNNNMNEKSEKVVKTVIYKDDELVHTVVFVK